MSKKKYEEKRRKLIISDDISHMGITEEQYRVIENSLDPSLNEEGEPSIQCTIKDVINSKNKGKPKND